MNWPLAGNAYLVRDTVRQDALSYIRWKRLSADISTDTSLRYFLEDQYEVKKRQELYLTRAVAGDEESTRIVAAEKICAGLASLENCLRNVRMDIHPIAEGLFAFGRADVYPDIVDTLGPLVWDDAGHARDWALIWCLVDLLPFPAPPSRSHGWIQEHLGSIRAWLDGNWTRLEWDETEMKYRLTEQSVGAPPWAAT